MINYHKVGADIGGSIRMPSYFCGVFGHKTTPEIVSTEGMYPHATPSRQRLLSIGPMCRFARDLKPMLKVMAGENVKKLKLDSKVDLSKIRVFYMEGDDNPLRSPVQQDIKDAMQQVVDFFDSKRVPTKKVYFKQIRHGFNIWIEAMTDRSAPRMSQELANLKGEINPWIEILKSFFGLSKHTFCAIISCFGEYLSKFNGTEGQKRFIQMRQELSKELHELLGE